MPKTILLIIVSCFVINVTNSQITKGNWMVGGNGLFAYQNLKQRGVEAKGFNIKLSPNIGYFFADKFAGGVRPTFNYSKVKYSGAESATTQFGFGPYLRYYFLNVENSVNLFSEASYQYLNSKGTNTSSEGQHAFTFSAGPVIYFNSSVGLELTLNYEHLNSTDASANTLYFGIGFQIHLEKDKN